MTDDLTDLCSPRLPLAVVPTDADAGDEDLQILRSDPELADMFITEARDHLGTIEGLVLQLERMPGDERLLDAVFRPFHTIKANAGALGVKSVQELAHQVETLLDLGRSGGFDIGPAETDVILRSVDLLTTMIDDLAPRLAGSAPVDVRAANAELTGLVARIVDSAPGGFESPKAAPRITVEALATAPRGGDWKRTSDDPAGASVRVDTRKLDRLVDTVGELLFVASNISADSSLAGVADARLSRSLAHLRRITRDLQQVAMSMRLVPIRQTFQRLSRLVRDLSKESGRPIDVVLSGEDTELDRKVVECIIDPLTHMVRNSVDHGIEPPGQRAGKSEVGRISLSAHHQDGNVVIVVADDGRGLDADQILAKAVAQGIVKPGESMEPREVHALIFRPGLSTAEAVSAISGRGVGMDVVRRNVEALRGRVDIQTRLGQGTAFRISLPLTVAESPSTNSHDPEGIAPAACRRRDV